MASPPDSLASDSPSLQFSQFRRTGDPAALTAVFDQVAPELLLLGRHLAQGQAEAEDLVQETFLIAIRKARRWDERRPVVPWLTGILTREARRTQRRGGRAIDAERLRQPAAESGERVALDTEIRGHVESALGRLPRRYADVVRSALLQGEEPAGIAARLGLAPGTVRVQLHRGLALLRSALPAGISLGAAAVLAPRGLAAVREAVEANARRNAPLLAKAGGSSFGLGLGVTLMGTKALSVGGLVVVFAASAFFWSRTEEGSEPSAGLMPVASVETEAAEESRTAPLLDQEQADARLGLGEEEGFAVQEESAEIVVESGPCRVTGRMVSLKTGELKAPWAYFWPAPAEATVPSMRTPLARASANGKFGVELPRGLSGDLLFTAEGHCIGQFSIVVPDTGDLDLGDLELDSGVSISGTAWHGGERVPAGTPVLAQAEYEETPFALMTNRVQRWKGGYIRSGRVSIADEQGDFALEGLEPGVRYSLAAVPPAGEEDWAPTFLAASAGLETTAPASGIRLDSGLIRATLVVSVEGEPANKARVTQQLAPDDPRRALGPAAKNLATPYSTGADGELDFYALAGHPLYIEVRGPECSPNEQMIPSLQLVPGARISVDLVRDVQTGTVEVELAGLAPGAMDGAQAVLLVYGSDLKRVHVGPVPIANGIARFEGLACKLRDAMFFFSPPTSMKVADLPFGHYAGSRLAISDLQPNEERRIRLEAPPGGRVELSLTGTLEGHSPVFELIEASGNPVRPIIYEDNPDGGHVNLVSMDGFGPYTLGLSLPPGSYTLHQASPAYQAGDVEVEVRPSEVTRLTFHLEQP